MQALCVPDYSPKRSSGLPTFKLLLLFTFYFLLTAFFYSASFNFIRVHPRLIALPQHLFYFIRVIRAYPWLKAQWLFYFFPNKAFKDLLKVTSAPVILAYIKPSSSCRNKFALRAVAEFLLTDMLR